MTENWLFKFKGEIKTTSNGSFVFVLMILVVTGIVVNNIETGLFKV